MDVHDLKEIIDERKAYLDRTWGYAHEMAYPAYRDLLKAHDAAIAFLTAPPFEDGKPVNKARLEWLAADDVADDEQA